MGSYAISYEILDYDLFYQRLSEILNNPQNKFLVKKHSPIGKSSCGFSIEHYSIGEGAMHILYMAGAHGNEIIGPDFVLQLMRNLALGKGVFQDFNPSLFTIDFIPLQNPEGFFTTTYALKRVMNKMTLEEKQNFCKEYYLKYRKENERIKKVNALLKECSSLEGEMLEHLLFSFWQTAHGHLLGWEDMVAFLQPYCCLEEVKKKVKTMWEDYFGIGKIDFFRKEYLELFASLDLTCIPLRDDAHISLRKCLENMYKECKFPFCTLGNFLANASGINLNDNNPYYFDILNELKKYNKNLYASPVYPILKSDVSPYGTCSIDENSFSYALENGAVLNFLDTLEDSIYAFFNVHGTGGLLYAEPYFSVEKNLEERDFSFYINNRIATEYLREIKATYLEKGKWESYTCVEHPREIRGFGDMLRSRHIGHFLLELSRAGGNPIGPYIEPNYTLTMEANFNAFKRVTNTILEVYDLYDKMYVMHYDGEGKVKYETRKLCKKDCNK